MTASVVTLNGIYILCASLFIFGLKLLSKPSSARMGNMLSGVGMTIAILATIAFNLPSAIEPLVFVILLALISGAILALKVKMTSMPEMVCIFNGVGGLSSYLVTLSALLLVSNHSNEYQSVILVIAMLIGGITFSGSFIAFFKLGGHLGLKAKQLTLLKYFSIAVTLTSVFLLFLLVREPSNVLILVSFTIAIVVLGIVLVIPIGGADMPVVVSLLNSYSGLAACAAGISINNVLLIVAGSLVGASGIILTKIMCKSMNRSLSNVLFSGFKSPKISANNALSAEPKAMATTDAYYMFEAARSVVIIPGYGMAVSQAQHALKELEAHLKRNGAEVVYAIHPVAGRMPGHMNVLLSEADIGYDLLIEMDDINPRISTFDIALVVGANDVVNPDARESKDSPIYGMPIINADLAKTVFVLKRGMATGFSGIENPLFTKENTYLVFGDAKKTISEISKQFQE